MSPTTLDTILIWSPYLQLQNVKLNPLDSTVTSPFHREINYA